MILSLPAGAELRLPSADRQPDVSGEAGSSSERNRPFLSLPKPATTQTPAAAPRRQEPAVSTVTQPEAADEPEEEGDKAFSYEVIGTVDWFSTTAGGIADAESGSALPGLIELAAELDTGAAGLWDNGNLFLHLQFTFGSSPGDFVGDVQGVSNIDDGGESAFAVWEAWYEHEFPFSHSAFQIGVLDFNAEFYVAEYANLFLNGTFGMGAELGSSAGVSAYPVTSLGARFKLNPTPNSYLMLGVWDGMPGPGPNDVTLSQDDGSFWAVETGLSPGDGFDSDGYYKLGLGAWYLRQDITHWTGDEPPAGSPGAFVDDPAPGTGGAYILGETSLGTKLGLFFKAGLTSSDNNRFNTFYSAGLNYVGLIPGREQDIFGMGFVRTAHSDDFLSATGTSQDDFFNDNGFGYFKSETTYEITYSAQIFDWLLLQPDVQYVLQPGMDPTIGNAIVVGARLQLVY